MKKECFSRPIHAFHVMTKPTGSLCNLDCQYCFYLEKAALFPKDHSFRMSDHVLENYVRQYIAAQHSMEVSFAWQGGEPTLMGVDFFRRAVALQKKYADGKTITNSMQTNGTLLDDEWGEFLASEKFLVGLSIDGPEALHDIYRRDKGGGPSFKKVMRGLDVLKKHAVQFNTLTVVNRANSKHPLETYRFLKEAGSEYIQFIPLIERMPDSQMKESGHSLSLPPDPHEPSHAHLPVTPWSVESSAYGQFLIQIFDEWVRHDVGKVFVQIFDVALNCWAGMKSPLCVFSETCGTAMALEHNGDVFSCDHYVYSEYRLGNIAETGLDAMASSMKQRRFGDDKQASLPRYCKECPFLFACNGECPKHRFLTSPSGEPGLNYLCSGYRVFFKHIAPHMETMVSLLRSRRAPAEICSMIKREDQERLWKTAGRNDPCPCGSGKKRKLCCGDKPTTFSTAR